MLFVLLKHGRKNSQVTLHGRRVGKHATAYLLFSMKERGGKRKVTGIDKMRNVHGSEECTWE
jgi:hypothetical protein